MEVGLVWKWRNRRGCLWRCPVQQRGPHLGGCSFIENSVTGRRRWRGEFRGGTEGCIGAAICSTGILEMKNCTLANLHATGGRGGGVPSNLLTVPGAGGNAEGAEFILSGQLAIQSLPCRGAVLTGGLGSWGGRMEFPADRLGAGSGSGWLRGDWKHLPGRREYGPGCPGGLRNIRFPRIQSGRCGGRVHRFYLDDGPEGHRADLLNPRLGPLDDHLGPTPPIRSWPTVRPSIGASPLVNPWTSARAPRPSDVASIPNVGDGTDIGAHEWVQPHLAISAIPGSVVVSWSIFTPGQTLWSGPGLSERDGPRCPGVPAKVGSGYGSPTFLRPEPPFFRLVGPLKEVCAGALGTVLRSRVRIAGIPR